MTGAKGRTFHPRESQLLVRLATVGRAQIPPLPDPSAPPAPPSGLGVFATGTDWVQLTWRRLGPGPITFTAGDTTIAVDADGGPGAVTLDALGAGTEYEIALAGPGVAAGTTLRATTLRPPPGEELFRIGTLNDVHIGQTSAGFFHTLVERPEPTELHPVRCLRAAVDEALGWSVRQLVVKGDLTHASQPDHWRQIGDLLAEVPVPIEIVPGNHETSTKATVEPQQGLAEHGFRLIRGVQAVDRPGVRLILADSTISGSDWGQIDPLADQIVDLARRADGGVLLGIHHQPMRFDHMTYLPPGIVASQWRPFVRRLAAANPAVLVSTGHTHRHRRHRYGPIVVTEVGSTKDYPGTWAGYQIYESGIVQTVRRIAEPTCIRWTDHTRRAALGVWGLWSPGHLADRCFSLRWPRR